MSKFTKLVPLLNKLSGVILINVGSALLVYTYILKPSANVSFEAFTGWLLLIVFILINATRPFKTLSKSNSAKEPQSQVA